MRRILMIQGANMVWLGKREPELYGTTTAAELDEIVLAHAKERGCAVDIVYTNVEGMAIDRVYQAVRDGVDGLLMNPAGFTYAGYALRDCIRAVAPLPYVEVHMTNIEKRGMHSVLAEAAVGMVAGFGVQSYRVGMDALLQTIEARAAKA